MPEDKATIIREFVKATAAGDTVKVLSYCTDDVVSIGPGISDKGRAEIGRGIEAAVKNFKDMKVTEVGNGISVNGDKAFYEHVFSGTYQGQKFEVLAIGAYEFSGDKIKSIREVYDRLLIAKQVAKGWLPKTMINMIVRQMEKAMQ